MESIAKDSASLVLLLFPVLLDESVECDGDDFSHGELGLCCIDFGVPEGVWVDVADRCLRGHGYAPGLGGWLRYLWLVNDRDVIDIARNTGLSPGAVRRAKDHLFIREHQLDDGIRRFDADPEIANAWRRMETGTHRAEDIDLINHERFESILMQRYGQPYRCAHLAANSCGFPSPID